MKSTIKGLLSVSIVLVSATYCFAQQYSLEIVPATFTLEGKNYQGYATTFIQSHKEVKKEWWRYVNRRTIIFNKKSHYELTFPAKRKESNTPLRYISQLIEKKKTKQPVLRMALVPDDIDENQIKALKIQAKYILQDFKINYFTGLIQPKIEKKEKASTKISRKMDKRILRKNKLQQQLEKNPNQKEQFSEKIIMHTKAITLLQQELYTTQQKLVQLKKELSLIQ